MVTKHIEKFMFEKAFYKLSDSSGNEILLTVRYSKRKAKVKVITVNKGLGDYESVQKLKKEAILIARELIERKSGINFAQKS